MAAVDEATTTPRPSPLLLVSLAAASVKAFLRSYAFLLRSLALLLSAATAPSGARRPDDAGRRGQHGPQDDEQQAAVLTGEEVEAILQRMGLATGAGDGGEEAGFEFDGADAGLVSRVFDADEPSLEEARRAFAVFDEDGDGFIGPADLRSALARLGFLQADVAACRRMIDAASCGGGGNMSLSQFVRFLESGF